VLRGGDEGFEELDGGPERDGRGRRVDDCDVRGESGVAVWRGSCPGGVEAGDGRGAAVGEEVDEEFGVIR